jgi:hypothetical protein
MSAYGVSGAISAGLGVGQLIAGALTKVPKYTYKTPEEIRKNQELAQRNYGASTLYGLAGQGAINNQNQSALASALRAYQNTQQNPAAMLAGITATTANQQRTNADIGIKAAQNRENRMDRARAGVIAANKDLAAYKDKEFEINVLDPARRKAAAKSAYFGGGIQNLAGGLTTLGSAKYRKTMDDYYRSKI